MATGHDGAPRRYQEQQAACMSASSSTPRPTRARRRQPRSIVRQRAKETLGMQARAIVASPAGSQGRLPQLFWGAVVEDEVQPWPWQTAPRKALFLRPGC